MASFRTSVGGALLAGYFAFAAAPASAAMIYSQAPVDGGTGFFSNYGALAQSADDFLLGADAALVRIGWWGSYRDPALAGADSFAVRVFDTPAGGAAPIFACGDAAALPPAACGGVTASATGLSDSTGSPVFKFELGLAVPLDLVAGASYILAVTNENPDTEWYWLQSTFGNGGLFRMEDSEDFVTDGPNLAFMLEREATGIPEPGTLALLGIALLAFGIVRRSARRSA